MLGRRPYLLVRALATIPVFTPICKSRAICNLLLTLNLTLQHYLRMASLKLQRTGACAQNFDLRLSGGGFSWQQKATFQGHQDTFAVAACLVTS